MQIFINILITASIYIILSTAFYLVYSIDKIFNITYAGIIVTNIYLTYLFNNIIEVNFIFSFLCSLITTLLINSLLVKFLFSPLKNKGAHPYVLLIASLGIYIIIISIIGLTFGYESIFLLSGKSTKSLIIFGGSISLVQLLTILISVVLFGIIFYFYTKTHLGSRIRAISSNNKLAVNFGINTDKYSLLVNACAAFLFSIIGILIGIDTGATPSIGFNLLLYGIIIMIIGGTGNLLYLALASILLATIQHLSAYYFDTKWMDAIAYIILILFLIWKPLGFSGKKVKKVEI
jgi:branched-chain amino acid transport system permease protein